MPAITEHGTDIVAERYLQKVLHARHFRREEHRGDGSSAVCADKHLRLLQAGLSHQASARHQQQQQTNASR